MSHHVFKIFKNRDYRWANELTLKTAFLTLLYNDIIFIMDSETEISRRYADLTMLIRQELKKAGKQVCGYGASLEKKYGNLRLKKFIVVSLGFEKVRYRILLDFTNFVMQPFV